MPKIRFEPWLPSSPFRRDSVRPDARHSVRNACEHAFVPGKISFTESELRRAVATSRSYSEALRKIHLRPAGGNHRTIKKYVAIWNISTEHFDPDAIRRESLYRPPTPLAELLVEHSTYHRGHLKRRLLAEGIKQPRCELCGQDEIWRGRPLALILDHINGVPDDNRLENLRIVCPNCAATFETHCGRKNRSSVVERQCLRCRASFVPADARQRYCSKYCGVRHDRTGVPRPEGRKVRERPPYEQLLAEVAATSWSAVGRKYGVSDNAIRKWAREYERARASVEAAGPAGRGIPGPAGVAGAEVDASEPAVDRRAAGGSREDGCALGRELVAAVREGDERVQVAGEREDGGIARPRRVLVLRYRGDQLGGRERAGAQCVEDLAFDAGEAVRQLLQPTATASSATTASPFVTWTIGTTQR
jgi:transposase-like protein